MKQPYTFDFGNKSAIIKDLGGKCLEEMEYHLPYPTKSVNYALHDFQIKRQFVNYKPFFIDFIQLESHVPSQFQFMIPHRQIFLFFMLDGSFSFYTDKDEEIVRTIADHFLISIYEKGKYSVEFGKGKHQALVVSLLPDWIKDVGTHYPNINRIFTRYQSNLRSSVVMQQTEIAKHVKQNIEKILSGNYPMHRGRLDVFLRDQMTNFIESYDRSLYRGPSSKEIKTFIHFHYRNPEMNLKYIIDYFQMDRRRLQNQFCKSFGITPKQYYILLRMEAAHGMMINKKYSIAKTYRKVGFKDRRSFDVHYIAYLKKQHNK